MFLHGGKRGLFKAEGFGSGGVGAPRRVNSLFLSYTGSAGLASVSAQSVPDMTDVDGSPGEPGESRLRA